MSCKNDPRIEQMEADLFGGGWTRVMFGVYRTPWGVMYRGPHKAWHIWAGEPMDEPETRPAPPTPNGRWRIIDNTELVPNKVEAKPELHHRSE